MIKHIPISLEAAMLREYDRLVESTNDTRSRLDRVIYGCCMDQPDLDEHFQQKLNAAFELISRGLKEAYKAGEFGREKHQELLGDYICFLHTFSALITLTTSGVSPENLRKMLDPLIEKSLQDVITAHKETINRNAEEATRIAELLVGGSSRSEPPKIEDLLRKREEGAKAHADS